jgi:cytochrome c-type biogenesis protein CcmH
MVAEVGQFAPILVFLIVLVATTAAVTVVVVRRSDARRAAKPAAAMADAGLLNIRTAGVLIVGLAAVLALGATAVRFGVGRPAAAPASLPAGHPSMDPAALIPGLEARLANAPDDPEGWRMLGWSYLQVGRNVEAAQAYGRAADLDPHNAEYRSGEGEASVLAAGGQVTPAAEAAFRKAVQLDPADARARYYLAIAKDQKGDSKGAMDDWIALLKSAPPGSAWAPQVRAFVEKVAAARGVDLAGRLPPASAQAATQPEGGAPGPTPDQVAAAGQMSAGDREAMIAGMVQRLADRLAKNPRDLDGWQRLIRARMVLGQADAAAQAYRDGMKAFSGSGANQAALRRSAADLGVPGS